MKNENYLKDKHAVFDYDLIRAAFGENAGSTDHLEEAYGRETLSQSSAARRKNCRITWWTARFQRTKETA